MLKWLLGGAASVAAIALISTQGNGLMTRFEHRTFICNSDLTGPFELVINKMRVGKTVQFVQPNGTTQLKITGVTGDQLIAVSGNWSFSVNTITEEVIAKNRSELTVTRCRSTTFSM